MAGAGAVLLAGLLPVAAASASYPPLTNPAANIAPNPNFDESGSCVSNGAGAYSCPNPCVTPQLSFPTTYVNSTACTDYVLSAIDAADVIDGATPMVLPSNWFTLTIPEQLFVAANLERVDHGYPPYLGLNDALDAAAQGGANANADPAAVTGFAASTWGGTWAQAFSPLVADYGWMYADGWGGSAATTSNIDCTSASAPSCWGHRDILLGFDPSLNFDAGLNCTTCEMGAAFATVDGYGSYDDVVARPTGSPPAMSFTWASEVAYFPPGSVAAGGSNPAATTTTTTTTTTSTTTTATVPAPIKVTERLLSYSTSSIRVRWWATHSADLTAVRLAVYDDAHCSRTLHLVVSRYAGEPRPSTGVVASAGPDFYRAPVRRSFRVLVDVGAGLYWGACVPLAPR